MQMVICPNGGRCGSQKHRVGTKAYHQCFEQSASGGGQAKRDVPAPTSVYERQKQSLAEYRQLIKTMQERKVYSAAESFINKNMVIQEDMVQTYINDPDEINDLCREEWDGYILDDIKEHSEEIFDKLGMDIDECDSEEISRILDAAFEADRSDIAGAMAKNMGPRTLSLASVNYEDDKRTIFSVAGELGEVGSDEWFDELGALYHEYAHEYGLIDRDYDYLLGTRNRKSRRTDLQESVTSLLKDAIEKRGVEVKSSRDLPDLSVVWKGSLHDIAPAYEDEDFFTIESPYLVASYGDAGVVGEPVPIRGYRMPFAGRVERNDGAYSGITDEMTSDKAVFKPEQRETLDLRESKVTKGDYLAPRDQH